MTTRRLVWHWIVGLLVAAGIAWIATPSGATRLDAFERAHAPREVAAWRLDSLAAVAAARVAARARGDSVLAVVFVPPEPGRSFARELQERRSALPFVLGLIAMGLFRSTATWLRNRRDSAT